MDPSPFVYGDGHRGFLVSGGYRDCATLGGASKSPFEAAEELRDGKEISELPDSFEFFVVIQVSD